MGTEGSAVQPLSPTFYSKLSESTCCGLYGVNKGPTTSLTSVLGLAEHVEIRDSSTGAGVPFLRFSGRERGSDGTPCGPTG